MIQTLLKVFNPLGITDVIKDILRLLSTKLPPDPPEFLKKQAKIN